VAEPVCTQPTLAYISSTDDDPFRNERGAWSPGAPSPSFRVLPQAGNSKGRVRREAHGLTRCGDHLQGRTSGPEAVSGHWRDRQHLHPNRTSVLLGSRGGKRPVAAGARGRRSGPVV